MPVDVELLGRPRSCRFRGLPPPAGAVLRARRAWYVVLAVRATRSTDYPSNLTIGRITETTARSLAAAGAPRWSFAWDRGRRRKV